MSDVLLPVTLRGVNIDTCPIAYVRCPVSGVRYPVSGVWCPVSDFLVSDSVSGVRCPRTSPTGRGGVLYNPVLYYAGEKKLNMRFYTAVVTLRSL